MSMVTFLLKRFHLKMNRKWPTIDLMKLRAISDKDHWNIFLKNCQDKHDINRLTEVLYGLQAGMDKLVKEKLNSDELCIWFARLTRSIELTVKSILREKYPLPNDRNNKEKSLEIMTAKRKRDAEFMNFLVKSRF